MRFNPKHSDDGWTLVETMIVVLVIGLLIAIAIPVFLGSRNRSHDQPRRNLRLNRSPYPEQEVG